MAEDKDKPRQAVRKPVGSVFDVSRPGKTLASPTSRPVILGHKPEAQAAQTAVSGVGEVSPLLNRRKIEITPAGDVQVVATAPSAKNESAVPAESQIKDADGTPVSEKDQDALAAVALDAATGPPALPQIEHEEAPKPLADKPLEPPEEKPSQEKEGESAVFTKPKLIIRPLSAEESKAAAKSAESEPKPESKPEPEEATQPESSDQAEPESEAAKEQSEPSAETDEAATPEETTPTGDQEETPAVEGQEQEESAKPEPHIEPLFDEHGVIVSNHQHHHRHSGLKTFLLLVLILLLAAAALDIVLDLGILNLPNNINIPHTDFL